MRSSMGIPLLPAFEYRDLVIENSPKIPTSQATLMKFREYGPKLRSKLFPRRFPELSRGRGNGNARPASNRQKPLGLQESIGPRDGVEIHTEADEKTSGPASLVVIDPDGNPILIDQHV